MFSALSSFIWGTSEEENINEQAAQTYQNNTTGCEDHVEVDNDWIFVHPKDKSATQKLRRKAAHFDDGGSESSNNGMEESWLVTPPQCFNSNGKRPRTEVGPMENLLIEHPSMSIYHGQDETAEETGKEVVTLPVKRDTHKAVAGRLQALEKRPPLKDLNKSALRKQNSSKNMKRRNQVYVRQNGARKNKQYGRMTGKHTALVGKRAA